VSRHHCLIASTPQGFLLRDCGGTNGTRLGHFRIESAYVQLGASIDIGETTLEFELLNENLHEPLSWEARYGGALGTSVAMRRLFAILPRVAQSDSTVLIEGETGTGKTLLAEAIHEASSRAAGPFTAVECSSIPPTLIESELFGHDKGAFTGAHEAHVGVFEATRGGTVLLDEIAGLPLDVQPKLLRALEARQFRRIGSTKSVPLDVRLIAATHRDLRAIVNRGAFRSDLFFRLNTVSLRVPSLRERREDIPILVQHFYQQFKGEGQTAPAQLIAEMERREWTGNIRELHSAVERAVLLDDPELWRELNVSPITATPVTRAEEPELDRFVPGVPFRAAKESAVRRWERAYLTDLLKYTDGKLLAAARAASIDRTYLRELLRRNKIKVRDE
jgi:DNA-binding NtrC family response regulator